jgi:hypothetical protein
MSYKTNPISNRLKIIKGWKNPYLPTKTLNYARDISLWFKVYLLLKTFLNLKKIQLLSFEIRFAQQNQKLLYLVINKKKNQQKKRKKKKVFVKKIQTPIRKSKNLNSIFFLYQNLKFLKMFSFWNRNLVHKKVLSKFWLTKPKVATWINTYEKIINLRQTSESKFKFLQKNKNLTPKQYLKLKFYTKKQKQILTQKLRIKKFNLILYAKLFSLLQQKKSQFLQQLIINLEKKIEENHQKIKKINQIYKFLLSLNKSIYKKKKKTTQKSLKNNVFPRVQWKKLIILQKLLRAEFKSWNRTRFSKQKLPKFLFQINKNIRGSFLKKDLLLKKIFVINFLLSQTYNKSFLSKNYFLFLKLEFKLNKKINKQKINNIRNFLKENFFQIVNKKQFGYKFYKIYIWHLLRLKKKNQRRKKKVLKNLNKNLEFRLKTNMFKKYNFFLNKKIFNQTKIKKTRHGFQKHIKEIKNYVKKNQIRRNYQYRIPYRKMYFDFIRLNTKFHFKYLIQNFVKKFFNITIEAKIIHFLNAHKNQNYFRLVFPIWKKKKNQRLRKFRQSNGKQKQIILTSRLQLVTFTKKTKITNRNKTKITHNLVKTLKKKDFYSLARKKIKNLRLKNSFKRIKGSKDFRHSFKYFIPALMYFSRTLDPQILADLLSKVVYKAKKQTWLLSTIKDILKIIRLGKNVGYKIALSGRINSADKSRLIFITRKNVPLQVFDKNMNFAYSQAKARIGVFGIKIWVYF